MVSALTISQWRNVLIVYACVPVLILLLLVTISSTIFVIIIKWGFARLAPRLRVSLYP